MKFNITTLVTIALFLIIFNLRCIDNAHFYRASYFWGEPRFETSWLYTAEVSTGWASTDNARNSNNTKVPLLDIYGPFNMQDLGKNIPNLDPNNPLDKLLIDLQNLPHNDTFGHLQFSGKFEIIESVFSCYQNLINGFYLMGYLPLRRLKLSNIITFKDLSPAGPMTPNHSTPVWQEFLTSFDLIMERYGLCLKPVNRTGVGDLSLLVGWTINYQETTHADYVDVSSRIGVLFPTGRKKDIDRPFDLPQGYNGHYGLPIEVQASFGAFEWFTMGFQIGALFLFDRTQELRLKTANEQNGLIKLARGKVEVDAGTLWNFGSYLKADHFAGGFSALVGYSFNRKDADTLELSNNDVEFDPAIINNDSAFRGWNMHVLNVIASYDFAKDPCKVGWRLDVFYNRVLAGKRVFNANTKAFNIGLDVVLTW